ncbi:MAG: FAD-dependent oxidoreductase [Acidobacteria bacterium]|nr:FAD-dependent oxidoreductase [Acidobacteriota bacterium]
MAKKSRREFIKKGVTLAGATAAAPALAQAALLGGKQTIARWDEEADVVILGSGLAGCVSAIEAYETDHSANILIVEKMPERYAGGNSRVSGGALFIPQDLEALLTYRRALDEPNPVPEDVVRTWGEAMVSQEAWIKQMASDVGMKYVSRQAVAEFTEFRGSSCVEYYSTIVPNPSGVWKAFKAQVDRRPIRVMYQTRAVDLVQDPDSLEIFGVLAEQHGKQMAIKARRAVVMCTGGFENNLDIQRNYSGLERVYPLGTPGNTGDGIKMLQKAGADMWHLRNRNFTSGIWPAMKFPEYEVAFIRNMHLTGSSWIDIGKDNRRFYNETVEWHSTHYRQKVHGHWVDTPLAFVLPAHMIFDETTRKQDCLSMNTLTWNPVVENCQWSPDNSAEIAKGWIKKADTIRELARLIGRDPDEVETTVSRFNESCAARSDPDFGRDPERMGPIVTPPFYAVEIVPGIVCTTGGAKRNKKSQVLDHSGKPIPRLYEAGELGSTFANLYENGSFLTECMVFGRIAGRHAVAESPWTDTRSNRARKS